MLELLLYWNHSKLNNHLQPPEGTRVSLVSWCTALTELSRRHQQSRPQRLALQPAGFPPICPVNLLIVLIKEKRKRRRSDTSVELWGSCLRGSLRLMGDHKGGYLSHVSQRGPHGTVVINVCVCTHGCFFFKFFLNDFHFLFLLVYISLKCPTTKPQMEELLFLTSQTDFLRNGLILYSGVNIAWLLLFCGNPSQTQSCWRTKSQYTLWPWPVNKAPPHPSFLDFLSSRDPSLLLPFFHFPALQSGFAYTNIGARSCPGAFLQTSASFSSFIHLTLCSQVPLIKLCGTYTNRRKQARKVVGNAGSMTLMRSLWLATQPKTNLPPSHLHPQLHWFLLDHACRRKPTQSEKAVVNIQRTRGWDTKGTADLDDQFSVQYMRHRPNSFYFWSSLNIWDQTCIKVTPENSLWRPCRAVSAVPAKGFTVKFAGGSLKTEDVWL